LNIAHIFWESSVQALSELRNNKMRTFLSLLGIMIGIFCIIAVQAAVDSLENNIRGSFDKLGNDVLYIDKRPWSDDGGSWWKYQRRPKPSYSDFEAIKEKSKLTEQVSYSAFIGNKVVKFQKNFIEGSFIIGVTEDYGGIFNIEIASGRFFNRNDVINGTNTVVIGYEVAQGLFGPADPIGRIVVLGGKKLQVIGVIAKTGKSLINPLDFDEACLVSYKTAQFYINLRGGSFFASINAKAKKGVDIADFRDEITGLLRAERRIKPMDESNFAINELSMLNKIFDSVFGVLKLAGLIIGGFAILVGMFSVANIMFVSVKERTHIIGIKKAIGATRNVILLEFLIESVVLCILGGILGLIFVFGVLKVASALTEFEMTLSISNILVGLVLSILVGILAGVIPAFNAAKMDPVEAIRQG